MNDFINEKPKETMRIVVFAACLLWHSLTLFAGLLLYLILIKIFRIQPLLLMIVGAAIAACTLLVSNFYLYAPAKTILHNGFHLNLQLWKAFFQHQNNYTFNFLNEIIYFNFSFLVAGFFSVIDLIKNNPHQHAMQALQQGIVENTKTELSDEKIAKLMKKLKDEDFDATLLGASMYTGKPVVVPDAYINQVMMVLGTTGAGKTITLRRFYKRAITKGHPLIIVDGKPDDENIAWLMQLAEKHQRKFYGFNCGNFLSYDPLAHGGFTELKDKIISLKDEWSSDYYKSIAEDYLQTTIQVLIKAKKHFDLRTIANCLHYQNLALIIREARDESLLSKVENLKNYDTKDITGLQAHLNILLNSELGHYFEKNATTFNLQQILDEKAVVYFALPALQFPSYAKVLGKLVINDLKATINRNTKDNPVFTVFDEFSVFAGEQVLNLVNMGRGKGVHAIFGTQGLADLTKVDATFKEQIMNCVNTLICHRLNDSTSAEDVASWIGTHDAINMTAQLNCKEPDVNLGTVKLSKEFLVHPDEIKRGLGIGEVFYVSKVQSKHKFEKVRVLHIC